MFQSHLRTLRPYHRARGPPGHRATPKFQSHLRTPRPYHSENEWMDARINRVSISSENPAPLPLYPPLLCTNCDRLFQSHLRTPRPYHFIGKPYRQRGSPVSISSENPAPLPHVYIASIAMPSRRFNLI